jgi:hypothetical protein
LGRTSTRIRVAPLWRGCRAGTGESQSITFAHSLDRNVVVQERRHRDTSPALQRTRTTRASRRRSRALSPERLPNACHATAHPNINHPASQPPAQHRLAGDAAGASLNLPFFRTPPRAAARLGLSKLPAARLKAGVGPPSAIKAQSNSRRYRTYRTAEQPNSRAYGHTGIRDGEVLDRKKNSS